MKKSFLIPLFFLSFLILSCSQKTLLPTNLLCENRINPKGIDTDSPRFSWQIHTDKRNQVQNAWRICIGTDSLNLVKNRDCFYDSDFTESRASSFVPYKGPSLNSAQIYYWKIKIRDKNGIESEWSEIAKFTTGLLSEGEKKASWIGHPDTGIRSSILRKTFTTNKEIKQAIAFASGIGAYYLYINNQLIGDVFMDAGMTEYEYRVLYGTYDITKHLKKGKNAVGLLIGEGMGAYLYSRKNRHHNPGKTNGPYKTPLGWAQIEILYTDGSRETIKTDNSWKVKNSWISYNNFFGGEDVNANSREKNWSSGDYDDRSWADAVIIPVNARTEARKMEPMRIGESFTPIVSLNPKEGIYLYDLGQNIGGIWKIKVKGKKGTRIKIRGSEKISGTPLPSVLTENKHLDFSIMHGRGGFFFRDCYSLYTLSGEGTETYIPRFFYNGFRYLEIETETPENIESIEPEGCFVYNDLPKNGDFFCSDTLLNKLHQMTNYTIKGILQSVPTSNPHSEKYGWTGDIHLFSEAANYNLNMYNLWKNWLLDVASSQNELGKGQVTHVIPNYQEYDWATSATWGAVLPILVENTYRYYGDTGIVREFYRNVRNWCDYLSSTSDSGIVKGIWADHVPPGINENGEYISRGQTPEIARLVATGYFFKTAEITSRLARILNMEKDAVKYHNLSIRIKQAFNENFLNRDKGFYKEGDSAPGYSVFQTSNLIPLEFNLAPENLRPDLIKKVINDIKNNHGGNLSTGIMGTNALVKVLPRFGCQQELLDIIHQEDYPGWGYWVKNGATTIWQNWSGTADHMHGMYGTVEEFNYNYVLGIRSPNYPGTSTGFKKIHIEPWVTGSIDFASGYLNTPQGKVSIDWKKDNNSLTVNISIPVNAKAQLFLPCVYNLVTESGKKPEDRFVTNSQNKINQSLILGSGNYSFLFKK